MTQIISNETVKKVDNEGIPCLETGEKGNLYLSFKVKFPTSLNGEQREQLKAILS